MRYTTVIDISELPDVYRNVNARLLYLHIALKSGYHDDDRDQITTSVRRAAADTGMTLSAARHALAVLEAHGLLDRTGERWRVKKWVVAELPTPRTQRTAAKDGSGQNLNKQLDQQVEEYRQRVYSAVRSMTREELSAWLQELEEGRALRHYGVQLSANKQNIEWLKRVIERL